MANGGGTANPIGIKIDSVFICKPNNKDRLNIMPQFIELTIYESIYSPVLQADLYIYDPISLFSNYPLLGEETIEVNYIPTHESTTDGPFMPGQLIFGISTVTRITPKDTLKAQGYQLTLFSSEHFAAAKINLMKSYNDTLSNAMLSILRNTLQTQERKLQLSSILFEETKGTHHFVVPNMNPLKALVWLNKRSVSFDSTHSVFFFYETLRGFNHRTYEHMLEYPTNGIINQNQMDQAAAQHGTVQEYIYLSNINDTIRQQIVQTMGIPESNMFTAFETDKRWDTIEKIVAGYFENEYFDIDILNKRYRNKRFQLPLSKYEQLAFPVNPPNKLADTAYILNTPPFVQQQQTPDPTPGSSTRVRYTTSQNQGDQPDDDNYFRDKWNTAVKNQTAMNQIVVRGALPGDTRLSVGDVIYVHVPDISGFTNVPDQNKDQFMSGYYIVTELKHNITVGMNHTMAISMSRTFYTKDPTMPMVYNITGGQ